MAALELKTPKQIMKSVRVVPKEFHENLSENLAKINAKKEGNQSLVESEKLELELKSKERFESYKEILYQKQGKIIPRYVVFYFLPGIILAFVMNSLTAFVPVSDLIENSDAPFIEKLGTRLTRLIGITGVVSNYFFVFMYWTNTRIIGSWKNYGLMQLWMTIFGILFVLIVYLLWTRIIGLNSPLPFMQNVTGVSIALVVILAIWYLLPKKWRKDQGYRKRYRYYAATHLYSAIIFYKYTILGKIFTDVPDRYQWMLSLTLPFIREFDIMIQEYLAHKSADAKDTSVTISVMHNINTQHCIFLAVMLGSKATDLSSWIILGSDFIYNSYLALSLIRIKKSGVINDKNDQKMYHLLFSLTVNELVEVLVPLTFLICFLSAYYGPNAEKIGGVKSDQFHYQPVSDIHEFIKKLMIFMIVDFCSVIFLGTMLWVTCKISLLRSYMTMQKEFWPIITITSAFYIWVVIM